MSEKNCKWHFATSSGGQDVGPNDAMSTFFKKDKYKSLVRECIQNSLDAVDDENNPVNILFKFRTLNGSSYPELFKLEEHIQGCIDLFSSQDAKDKFQPMLDYIHSSYYNGLSYLEISDTNTTGMEWKMNDTTSPFYSFVRCAGNSSKSNPTAGGSYGFGKASYFNASKLRTVLISTKCKNERSYFEGVSSLCTHLVNGNKLQAVGYYDNNNGEPICNEDDIPTRFIRNDIGLSAFILGIDPNICLEEIIESVCINFWLSIYENKLTITLNIGDDGVLLIDHNNIMSLIEAKYQNLEDKKRGHSNPLPYLNAVRFNGQDNKHIMINSNIPYLGDVSFYVLKDKSATDRILYMRSPRMLIKYETNRTSYGFWGVFICYDRIGNELLRKMESPQHDEWDYKNCQSGEDRDRGKKALKELKTFINNALADIFSANDSESLEIRGLSNYLYVPTSEDDDDIDEDSETIVGSPTGNILEDGSSPTSMIKDFSTNTGQLPNDSNPTGHIIIGSLTKAERDKNGKKLGGSSDDNTRRNSEGGILGSDNPRETYSDNDNGQEGTLVIPIDVSYRSFAQEESGEIVHILIINSDIEVDNGRIDLVIVGEQDDEFINIKKSDYGEVTKNRISNLSIPKGKSRLKIQFFDNMKYSIKIKAYEVY